MISALLLALLLAMAWPAGAASSEAPLYRYETGPDVVAAEQGDLAPLLPAGTVTRSARVLVPGQGRALAELELAESSTGPVLLEWRALVDDPFLSLMPPLAETVALASVLRRHVGSDALVVSWWDLSRQLGLLTGADVLFDQTLGEPVFVPVRWRDRATEVRAIERAFWQGPEGEERQLALDRLERLGSALLAPEQEGVAALRALAGERPVVLVLHLRDLIVLGQMAPDKLGVAFRDFGALNEVHGMAQRVRAWMRENSHAAYGLMQDGTGPVRAIALTDEASSQTLVARLLPLIGNDQTDVAGTRLVYRTGGYIVFELDTDADIAGDTAN